MGRLFMKTDEIGTNVDLEQFLAETGLKPAEDVDAITFSYTPRGTLSAEGDALLIVEGRFDSRKIAAAMEKRGAIFQKEAGFYRIRDEDNEKQVAAIALLSSRIILAGQEAAVIEGLRVARSGGTRFIETSGLGRERSRIDPRATAWLLVDVQRASRLEGAPKFPTSRHGSANDLGPALKTLSTVAMFAKDNGESIQLSAIAVTGDAETRELLEDFLRGMLAGWRMAAQEKQPELVKVVRGFSVQRGSDAVTISGSFPAELIRSHMAKK
jgi:hypothetical protein